MNNMHADCPNCGSDATEYQGEQDTPDRKIANVWECQDCGHVFVAPSPRDLYWAHRQAVEDEWTPEMKASDQRPEDDEDGAGRQILETSLFLEMFDDLVIALTGTRHYHVAKALRLSYQRQRHDLHVASLELRDVKAERDTLVRECKNLREGLIISDE